jgi:hypothetical protein
MKRIVFLLAFAILPLAGCPTAGGGASQPERLELQPGYFDPEALLPDAGRDLRMTYASVAVMLTAKRPSLIAFKLS